MTQNEMTILLESISGLREDVNTRVTNLHGEIISNRTIMQAVIDGKCETCANKYQLKWQWCAISLGGSAILSLYAIDWYIFNIINNHMLLMPGK